MKNNDGNSSSSMDSAARRRRSKRFPLEAVVHYQVAGSEFINLSTNISPDGIFIRNFSPPAVGTELRIRVHLPDEMGGIPVSLIGEVVRVVDSVGAEDRGMGVQFSSVQADTVEAVGYFIKEVYGLERYEKVEMEQDAETGKYSYTPGPQDTLRLHLSDPSSPYTVSELIPATPDRWLKSLLFLIVGILLGGGLVFFLFLLD